MARRRRGQASGRPSAVGRQKLPLSLLLRQMWLLVRKDIISELRTRETLVMLLFFSLLLVVIFVFSFWTDEDTVVAISPGVIWVTVVFTGTLGIDRSFAREQEGRTLMALVLVPGVARSLFAAKLVVNVAYMFLVELFAVPLIIVALRVPLGLGELPGLVLALGLGTLGFAAVGTVFSAMLVAVRRRGVLLPIVLYPVAIPLIVMGVKAVAAIIEHRPDAEIWSWVRLMVAVDVLYIVAGGWLFSTILEDE